MKKTPSYLKGLAETRARLAGDIERHERLLSEIPEKVAQARRELEACDLLIRRFDGRLDPQKIAPIRHWRYSKKRGVLRDTIIAIVKDSAPNQVTTLEVGWERKPGYEEIRVRERSRQKSLPGASEGNPKTIWRRLECGSAGQGAIFCAQDAHRHRGPWRH